MKEVLIKLAEDNLEIFKNKEYINGRTKILLSKSLDTMLSETRVYSDFYSNGLKIPSLLLTDESEPKISITKQDSFSAAIDQITNYGTSCILNFASAKHPGGGFLRGAVSQEEDLCRCSTLYAALLQEKDLYNWSANHLRNFLYSDWCIFSPNVIIIRDEHYHLTHPVACSVLTSPAPNKTAAMNFKKVKEDDIEKAMKTRCELVLKVATYEKKRNLVLGAFGCGVFGNDPSLVANIWKDLLAKDKYGRYFKNITFAIKSGHDEKNYNAFLKVFEKQNS